MKLFLLTCALTCLWAQQNTTLSTDPNVVNIFASVHNKQDKVVTNLTKDNFDLAEDGHSRTISYVSREADLPLTLGLLVDTSLSQREVLEEEKDASYRFLDQVLRPEKDKTFVIHFDREAELLQDLTSSRKDLRKAIDAIKPGGRSGPPPMPQHRPRDIWAQNPGPLPRKAIQRGTALYDAIFLATDEVMKSLHGRKAVIVLSDGVDQGSKESLYGAVRAAQRNGTLVYSIWFTGDKSHAGRKILRQISRETGGGFFEVTKKESIFDIYTRIQEELRNQYRIGYVSGQPATSSAFRRITLTTKKSGLTVQAPEGYFAISSPTP